MIGRILALSAAAFVSASAHAEPRQPTGKWTVEFADHDCILSRPYGTESKDALILSFKKLPMETGIRVYVFKYRGSTTMRGGKAKLKFGPGEPVETSFWAYLVTSGMRTVEMSVPDDSFKAAAQSGLVHVSAPQELEQTFAIPGFGPALKVLDQCALNLGELWGIPKDQQLRVSKPAKMVNQEVLFSSSDYPSSALRNETSGKTVLRLMVDEEGKPTDCVILKPSGDKALDTRSCGVMLHRAKFEPAEDAKGKPMRSVSVTVINWLLFN